jgi:hypothetical protein
LVHRDSRTTPSVPTVIEGAREDDFRTASRTLVETFGRDCVHNNWSMFELGASLTDERRRQGLELAAVEQQTRISVRFLRAMEEERFEVLPGDAYAKAFLRSYARFLGLDENRYVDEYMARFAQPDEPPLPPRASPGPRLRLRPARLLLAIGIAAAVALVVALIVSQRDGGGPSSRPAARPAAPAPPVPARARPKPAPPPAARPPAPPPPPPPPPVLALTASRGPCWVEAHIETASGKQIYSATLAEGRTLRFSLRRPLWLRLGNPSTLTVTIGGKPAAGVPTRTANIIATRAGIEPA